LQAKACASKEKKQNAPGRERTNNNGFKAKRAKTIHSREKEQNRTEQNYHTGTRREAVKESHAKPPTGRNKKSFCCG
jgi:hypothetical protein